MNYFIVNLKYLLKKRRYSIRQLAEKANLPASTLSRAIKRGPGAKVLHSTVDAVAKVFEIDPYRLEYANLTPDGNSLFDADDEISDAILVEETPRSEVKIPRMLGEIVDEKNVADALLEMGLSEPKTAPANVLRLPAPNGVNLFGFVAFLMPTKAMEPTIKSGSYVIATSILEPDFAESNIERRTPKDDQLVVARLEGETAVRVRRYLRGENGKGWLSCDNPKFPEATNPIQVKDEEILGIVIGVYQLL